MSTQVFKCLPKRSKGPVNIFVEKFYSFYRDGLDGVRDMRSLAALYFFVLLFIYVLRSIEATFFPLTVLFVGCSLFIANVQPYKKRYMSIIDSLIFANLAILSAAIDRNIIAFPSFRHIAEVLRLLPALGLFSFVIYKLLKKSIKLVLSPVKQKLQQVKQLLLICCNGHIRDDGAQDEEQENTENNHIEAQLPDRVVHPELYDVQEDQPTY